MVNYSDVIIRFKLLLKYLLGSQQLQSFQPFTCITTITSRNDKWYKKPQMTWKTIVPIKNSALCGACSIPKIHIPQEGGHGVFATTKLFNFGHRKFVGKENWQENCTQRCVKFYPLSTTPWNLILRFLEVNNINNGLLWSITFCITIFIGYCFLGYNMKA